MDTMLWTAVGGAMQKMVAGVTFFCVVAMFLLTLAWAMAGIVKVKR